MLELQASALLVLFGIMASSFSGAVKRTACDRCHGQKMRCIRNSASEASKCNRCIAANADCTFSLARKAGRPLSNKQSQDSQRSRQHANSEATQQTNDDLALLPTLLEMNDSSSFGTSPSSGVSSIFDTPMLGDESASILFSSSTSIAEVAGLDLDWGDADIEKDANMFSDSTQFHISQLPQLTPLGDTVEGPMSSYDALDSGIPYDDRVQRLASLSGEIFTQTHIHRNDLSPMDSIRKLIAYVILSSSTLLDILAPLRDTLAQQELKGAGRYTASMTETESSHLDTATTLQILTVYIRLVQLHFNLYTRIQAMVSPSTTPSSSSATSTSTSAYFTPPAFPSLTIGGISLAPYSRFQLRFLLQICVHHLGEIEALLGLPAGLRVNDVDKESEEQGGILGGRDGVTSLHLRTIMMGAGAPVRGIGETLEQLKKALEGRIKI